MLKRGAANYRSTTREQSTYSKAVYEAAEWFARHVTLYGEPYTLDLDQTRAAIDARKNTLVTARAGSGKTRVIVAKVAYLVAHGLANLDEIAIFMFNRTAAAEVNTRIAEVKVDGMGLAEFYSDRVRDARRHGVAPLDLGRSLRMSEKTSESHPVTIASTFHKFALDTVKLAGENPQLISEVEQNQLIANLLDNVLTDSHLKLSPQEHQEMLGIVKNFIARAGQKFPGYRGLAVLEQAVQDYCNLPMANANFARNRRFHQISYQVYRHYLGALKSPQIDFNLLMALATEYLHSPDCPLAVKERIAPLKYILIDEYQDFSYLFFALVQAMRELAPAAKLFAVGDDWQAINRFAGSDVNYFTNFAQFFPENTMNIPLATNYRSDRRIVELANQFMLEHYNPEATPAIPKSRQAGKIYRVNPSHQRFDASDIHEDGLSDGRFVGALSEAMNRKPEQVPPFAARLLKTTWRIFRHFPESEFMLLHRHNFTTCPGVTLEVLLAAIKQLVTEEGIMRSEDFAKRVRAMTMHKSKGLEAEIVILLELNRDLVLGSHPHATIFHLFGDTREAEIADQQRLIYVALTRAKKRLFILSNDKNPLI